MFSFQAGKESILQKETLEKTVISLQEQIDHINREKVRELWGGKGDPKEERLKVDDTTMPDQAKSSETGVEKEAEAVADIKDEEKSMFQFQFHLFLKFHYIQQYVYNRIPKFLLFPVTK